MMAYPYVVETVTMTIVIAIAIVVALVDRRPPGLVAP